MFGLLTESQGHARDRERPSSKDGDKKAKKEKKEKKVRNGCVDR